MSFFGFGEGDNNETTTRTKVEPWGPLQPYLKGAMSDAQNYYKTKGAPGYYPGSTVAPMSGYTKSYLDALATRGAYGSDLNTAAGNELKKNLSGSYLEGGNPYLQNAISAATRLMINAYNDQVMPGLDSNFSAAGRYGSGAHALASADAGAQLQNQIGDVASSMAYRNYGDERANMMNSMAFAPTLAGADYKDIGAMGLAGEGYDTYNKNLVDADVERYKYESNKDWNFLNDYVSLLGGAPNPGSSTNAKTPNDPWSNLGGYILNNMGQAAKVYGGGF